MERQQFSDETLMAYADGELDPDARIAVEEAMASDEELAGRVAMFADTARVARDAFAPMLRDPVPAALEARVRAMLTADAQTGGNVVAFNRPEPPAARNRIWDLPLAASIALIAGALGGYFLAGQQGATPDNRPRIAMLDQPLVAQALATVASGETVNIAGNGEFRAIASYRDRAGDLCREFEYDDTKGDALVAIACLQAGAWNVRFAVATAQADGGYAPASSLEALDAFLQATGAGEPLNAADEAAALKN